ncbi:MULTISPECIES: nitrous oxide-stimulated promoter family protein [Neobacillus]|uniref:Nitrous oxide-stimulated promoter family protein n=1 Tax=Neobacillus rhizophilus TaxID=2833579 RepID=A0A942U2N8_9BACI|nr:MULTISPECIES: nitrous oxide-stimulated promoter family protein [Neobacillus]MBS4213516.1 nitrous oxide-stimulated promoter family protein [Neobacillus rhizophilus]MBU8918074.1 nitrous oxide-stimulated promoter family protein [Bacillus sp. FJAT-29953]
MGARLIEPNTGPVIQKEKEIVKQMIEIYCRHKHKHPNGLCNECQELKNYCMLRLSFCRFGEEKSSCSHCKVHCYKPAYRQKIKAVMRYSGPWMLLYHPIYGVKHLFNKR